MRTLTQLSTGRLGVTARRAAFACSLLALPLSPVPSSAAYPASTQAACAPTATLVNPCRPWLGVYGHGYPQVAGDLGSQVSFHEQRIGRSGDIVRGGYHVGSRYLTPAEQGYAARPSTILLIDWKPSTLWASAGGGDPTVDRVIDSMADSIESVAPHKIMLVLAHEPENDVSSGTDCYTKSATGAGSPADYRAMWANVRRRFAARGVTNVVWVMDYMGYAPFDCLVPQLWPGNALVDWVMIDAYGTRANPLIDDSVGRFYRLLQSTSDPSHDFLSKPWGLGEFSIHGATQAQAYAYWSSLRAAVHDATYPKLKAYIVFDSDAGHGDNRVAYDAAGTYDPVEQAYYNAFAADAAFASIPVITDTTPPQVTRLALTPQAFRAGSGTTFRYTLSEPASVVVRIELIRCGRCGGRRLIGQFAANGTSGANRVRFAGRIRNRRLGPGRYRATLLARDGAGNRSTPRRIGFRVL